MRAFLKLNADRRSTQSALASIDSLLRDQGASVLASIMSKGTATKDLKRHLKRLHEQGLTSAEILERVGATCLLAWDDPASLPDDERLTWAIGRAVILARPLHQVRYMNRNGHAKRRSEPVPASVYSALGSHLRVALAKFFAPIYQERIRRRQAACAGR